jgi:hypothetical protein
VWKPAAVIESVAWTARSRNGTRDQSAPVPATVGRAYILLRPLRMTVSRVAIKSVMTASASCNPARTEMTSELGLVYFLVRAASRKTVKVWPVSLGVYCASWACVPRAQPRLRETCPASRGAERG